MEEYITPNLKLVSSTLSPLELHLNVRKDTLYMEMTQQFAKHQETGITKHQYAEVVNLHNGYVYCNNSNRPNKSSVNYTEYNLYKHAQLNYSFNNAICRNMPSSEIVKWKSRLQ